MVRKSKRRVARRSRASVNRNVNRMPVKQKASVCKMHMCKDGCGGAFYFLGFLGALVYYLTAGAGIVGFLKALVWPAFLVFELLTLLGA